MKQAYRKQPPTDEQHRVSHLPGAAVDDQVDDKRKAKTRSNDQRSRNDMAPCLYVVCIEDYARIRSRHLVVVVFYQHLLSKPVEDKHEAVSSTIPIS
jgi:hypothetical protein